MGLLNFLQSNDNKDLIEEGLCPNCWGRQEYNGEFRRLLEDEQIDIQNHQSAQAFIQSFVTKHLKGIQLKKDGDKYRCPSCNSDF